MDVGTRAKTSIGPWADFPVFSPYGQRLAYFSSAGLVVANSDGSSAQPLNIPRIIKSDAGLDWLPDSKWLITRDWYTPILVNVTTREVVQLRSDYYQIAVKR